MLGGSPSLDFSPRAFGVGLGAARLVARTVVLEVNGPAREEILLNGGSAALAGVVDSAFRAQLAAAHLVVPVTEGLRAYVADRSSTQAFVLPNGWLPSHETHRHTGAARVGLLPLAPKTPSSAVVGSPFNVYEYVAHGLAVVSTAIDGVVDSPVRTVVHTYRPGVVAECAAALREAMAASPSPVPDSLWSWESRASSLIAEAARLA